VQLNFCFVNSYTIYLDEFVYFDRTGWPVLHSLTRPLNDASSVLKNRNTKEFFGFSFWAACRSLFVTLSLCKVDKNAKKNAIASPSLFTGMPQNWMKQIYQLNIINRLKNPTWREADQLDIYKDERGVSRVYREKTPAEWSQRDCSGNVCFVLKHFTLS